MQAKTQQPVKCSNSEGGRIGGCANSAHVHIVIIRPDGTEVNYGSFCKYHSWITRFWGGKPGDRVEYRDTTTGEVVRSFGLVAR